MNTYTNPQMLSPEALHEAHLEMAKEYLDSKWDSYYYEVDPRLDEPCGDETENEEVKDDNFDFDEENAETYRTPNLPMEEPLEGEEQTAEEPIVNQFFQPYTYYLKLTDEQFSQIQKRLIESGEKELDKALADVPELMDLLLYKYVAGEGQEYGSDYTYASRIGNNPHQICNITVCTIGQTQEPQVFPYVIMLTKEDYLKLLVIRMDHHDVNFNSLYKYDIELYKKISEIVLEVEEHFEGNKKLTFTLVFDEIEKDVQKLLGDDETFTLFGDPVLFPIKFDDYIIAYFSEKKMAVNRVRVHHMEYNIDSKPIDELLYNIDVIAFMQALHVNSYKDAIAIMKDRFNSFTAIEEIQDFLEKENIAYRFTFL